MTQTKEGATCTIRTGTISAVNEKSIIIDIVQQSACAACHAKGACSSADAQQRQLILPNQGQKVYIGDTVSVSIQTGRGLLAVLIAYVLPLILLIVVLLVATSCGIPETWVAVISLTSLGLFYFILYLTRSRLARKFEFTIEKTI